MDGDHNCYKKFIVQDLKKIKLVVYDMIDIANVVWGNVILTL